MEFIAKGAFATGKYRNVFQEYGYKQEEIENRKNEIFQTIFYGTEEERLYHPVEPDMGYIEDSGNHDVRTEGMSYGMMMCVQMDKKEEFDRLWKWVMTYMYMTTGDNAGYFAWSCQTDGKKMRMVPHPTERNILRWLYFSPHTDGETEREFFVIAVRQSRYCQSVSIKVKMVNREGLCGIRITD